MQRERPAGQQSPSRDHSRENADLSRRALRLGGARRADRHPMFQLRPEHQIEFAVSEENGVGEEESGVALPLDELGLSVSLPRTHPIGTNPNVHRRRRILTASIASLLAACGSASAHPMAVPEPGSLDLLLVAGLGLFGRRRRTVWQENVGRRGTATFTRRTGPIPRKPCLQATRRV